MTEIPTQGYWAVAQTVSKMEHIVRREIEKTNHGAFVPTYARVWTVDGKRYVKEHPILSGYVFFATNADDWAGIPDIHGVYNVLTYPNRAPKRVSEKEMARLVLVHATGAHRVEIAPRYTKYYRGEMPKPRQRKSSRKPRPGKRIRYDMRAA